LIIAARHARGQTARTPLSPLLLRVAQTYVCAQNQASINIILIHAIADEANPLFRLDSFAAICESVIAITFCHEARNGMNPEVSSLPLLFLKLIH
jgi:hypothetical protein